jgi:DNA recombination protein RmuC
MAVLLPIVAIVAGAAIAWLFSRARLAALLERVSHLDNTLAVTARERDDLEQALRAAEPEVAALRERIAVFGDLKSQVEDKFKVLANDVLARNSASLVDSTKQILEPLRLSVERVDRHAKELEQVRGQAHGALTKELQLLAQGQERLRSETSNLVTALRAPNVRGRWGEVQLKRVIEHAGMLPHCDFVEQASVLNEDGKLLRPDVVIKIPGGKSVVIDAKTPLNAYLDWLEAEEEEVRTARLTDHARQVRDHIAKLAAKSYWKQFQPAPDFVVMFVPDEAFLRAAQEHDSMIQEDAWKAKIIPASPTNLLTLLRTVAAIWQQETAAEDARRISELGRELYERLGTVGRHVAKLGRSLDGAVTSYNEAVGSLETRVFVTARKLESQGIEPSLPELPPLERQSRPLQAVELIDGGTEVLELPPRAAADADAA